MLFFIFLQAVESKGFHALPENKKSPQNCGDLFDLSAGKEVHASNLNPQDLELIIEFIKNNLDEPIFDQSKVQKSRSNGFDGTTCENQGLNPESRIETS